MNALARESAIAPLTPPFSGKRFDTGESDRTANASSCLMSGSWGRLGDRSNITETLQNGSGKTHFFSLTGRSPLVHHESQGTMQQLAQAWKCSLQDLILGNNVSFCMF
jgi:hypothetical protein